MAPGGTGGLSFYANRPGIDAFAGRIGAGFLPLTDREDNQRGHIHERERWQDLRASARGARGRKPQTGSSRAAARPYSVVAPSPQSEIGVQPWGDCYEK